MWDRQKLTSIWSSLLSRYWIMKASWVELWLQTEPTIRQREQRTRGFTVEDMSSLWGFCSASASFVSVQRQWDQLKLRSRFPPLLCLCLSRSFSSSLVLVQTSSLPLWMEWICGMKDEAKRGGGGREIIPRGSIRIFRSLDSICLESRLLETWLSNTKYVYVVTSLNISLHLI